jgi:cytochrome c5
MQYKVIFFLICSVLTPSFAFADGHKIYNSLCIACHSNGNLGAPLTGSKENWAPRLAEGQARLIGRAYAGIGQMPPKGGNPKLSLADFADAATYIANQSGANWQNPDNAMLEKINAAYERRLQTLEIIKK